MPEIVDPPIVSPNPETTEEFAKMIVRKSIKAGRNQVTVAPKKRKPATTGPALFNKIEYDLSGLYDHLQGPILKELNRIISLLEDSRAGTGDPATLAKATGAAKESRVILTNLLNSIGSVQSNVRHTYAGGRSGFVNPKAKS